MRTIAIGDVHGCSAALDALGPALQLTPADTLIFLGDYVDRGPDSRGVIDRLLHVRQTIPTITLRGNHEWMMLRARLSAADARNWLSVGGRQALDSYGSSPGRPGTLADIPAEHWAFLEQTIPYFETETHVFLHANLAANVPMDQQTEGWLAWEFVDPQMPPKHPEGKPLICGHTSQKSGAILDLGSAIIIDTHAYGGGWLTALDVHSWNFWQADALGRVRTGQLR
ncbi:MAG: metallophosphoesterase family protein [Gemmataceae bacterium]